MSYYSLDIEGESGFCLKKKVREVGGNSCITFPTFSQDFISIGGCDLCTLKSEADKAIPFFL